MEITSILINEQKHGIVTIVIYSYNRNLDAEKWIW